MLKQVIRQRETEKRKKLALAAAFFVLVIAFTVFFLSQVPPVQRRYIYPYPHQELVELYARANGVDSALVASVIMTESRFRKDALSHRGAVGLMQIMPETGAWIAQQLEDTDYTLADIAAMGFPQPVLDALKLLTHDDRVPYMTYVAAIK